MVAHILYFQILKVKKHVNRLWNKVYSSIRLWQIYFDKVQKRNKFEFENIRLLVMPERNMVPWRQPPLISWAFYPWLLPALRVLEHMLVDQLPTWPSFVQVPKSQVILATINEGRSRNRPTQILLIISEQINSESVSDSKCMIYKNRGRGSKWDCSFGLW